MSLVGNIIGYDPGGNSGHGFARLTLNNEKVSEIFLDTLETVGDVIDLIESTPLLLGLGVDTLSCWHTGPSGWRPADLWLRQRYPSVLNSVVSPNSLFGSMGLNGMAVLLSARKRNENLPISETHPKVLYWALTQHKYNYAGDRDNMDDMLGSWLNVKVHTKNEHEWDAAVSAYALLQGITRQWTHDLHQLRVSHCDKAVYPCGETQFWWPE